MIICCVQRLCNALLFFAVLIPAGVYLPATYSLCLWLQPAISRGGVRDSQGHVAPWTHHPGRPHHDNCAQCGGTKCCRPGWADPSAHGPRQRRRCESLLLHSPWGASVLLRAMFLLSITMKLGVEIATFGQRRRCESLHLLSPRGHTCCYGLYFCRQLQLRQL